MKMFLVILAFAGAFLSACATSSGELKGRGEWDICSSIMRGDPQVLSILDGKTSVDLNKYWMSSNGIPMTPLYLAASYGNEKAVKLIIEKGVDVNKGSKNGGLTPLMGAVTSRMRGVSKLLLEAKANANYIDPEGYSLLDYSFYNDTPEIAAMLAHHGAKFSHVLKESQNIKSSAIWLESAKMTEGQRDRGTEGQRDRGTEGQTLYR